jgi:hypothetical protein
MRIPSIVAALVLVHAGAGAAPSCDRAQDAMALQTAALQQEMMVAALMCRDVSAYNAFVLSHQAALQESDRTLLAFFQGLNAATGDADYNFYKTELANGASLRSVRDPWFCYRNKANFNAAAGRSLEQALSVLPYPVDTGSLRCNRVSVTTAIANVAPRSKKRVRHRTWLGRLVDAIFD